MSNDETNDKAKEPHKSICNRCMSEITGIKEFDESDVIDLGAVFDHMEISLDLLHDKIKSKEQQMALVYKSYVLNDIDILKHTLGLVEYCECDEHSEEDEESEEETE